MPPVDGTWDCWLAGRLTFDLARLVLRETVTARELA